MASKVEDHSSGSNAMAEALQNSVILHQIFKNLENKLLLSSCRLVSQFWSSEATSFIQNYRQCKVVQPDESGACKFLRDFDNWLGQLEGSDRKLPFNGLKLKTFWDWTGPTCSFFEPSNELQWPNLKTRFNFKYLDGIYSSNKEVYCQDHNPFVTLIRDYGDKLRVVRVDTPNLLLPLWGDNPQLNLPNLKVLNISGTSTSGNYREVEKEAVEKLLNAASNLDTIVVVELDQLKLIPEEKLPSLVLDWPLGLNFHMEKNDQIDLLHVISQRSPCVKQLAIYVPPVRGQFEVEEDYQEGLQRHFGILGNAFALMVQANLNWRRDEHGDPEDEIVDLELRRSFDKACQRMLHNSHTNLETLSVYGVMPLMELDFPPLQNVTKFEVKKRYARELEPFWNSIQTLDYDRIMPGLQDVKICIHTGFFGVEPINEDEERDDDWEAEWPPVGNAVNNYYSSSTVNKLTLELQIRKVNLAPIQAVFPSVSKLHFRVPWTGGAGLDNIPLAQVWKYFPQLTELEITGDCRYIGPSLDADFCGITEEEAELLGQQTDEYLKLVHVVPIRPSVLTMKNLRGLFIEYDEFGAHDVDELDRGDRHYFISKVARLVAFDRMPPEVEVYIPSYMEAGQDIEEESDLEEDEMMDYDDSEDDDVVVLN